jgi:hypothetical protein
MFVVKFFQPKTKQWIEVSLWDQEDHFRGVAKFRDKLEAQDYKSFYENRMLMIMKQKHDSVSRRMRKPSLKIFEE